MVSTGRLIALCVYYFYVVPLEILLSLPLVGRWVDVLCATAALVPRAFSGAFIASGIAQCRRPGKRLKIFEFEGCPFCRKVREALSALDLDAVIYPCPRETIKQYGVCQDSRFRPLVTQLGGKQQFPYFIDDNENVKLQSSEEIVEYLWATYGHAATPHWTYRWGRLLEKHVPALSMYAPAMLRPSMKHGMLRVPSRAPDQPLVLWGFEGSPFVKLARGAPSFFLCSSSFFFILRPR